MLQIPQRLVSVEFSAVSCQTSTKAAGPHTGGKKDCGTHSKSSFSPAQSKVKQDSTGRACTALSALQAPPSLSCPVAAV